MRLGYLVATWPSPSETFLAREVAGLRLAGLDVIVFALHPGSDPTACYRPTLPPLRRLAHRALPAVLQACRTRAHLHHLPTAAWLAERLNATGCEALHAAWSNLPADLAWMAHQLGGPAYTVAAHAQDVFTAPSAPTRALTEAVGVTVCNRAAWRVLAGRMGTSRLVFLPHGLPLAAWPLRTQPPARASVLAVGRLVPKKGFDTLVEAVTGLAVRTTMLGEGPERARLAELALQRGVTLSLPGHVTSDGVREALLQASVLALPSRITADGDRDGLANVILEAMACGVPVVTTAAGGAADAVEHGRTGLLVPPDQPAALRAALARLLHEPALAARLARSARRRVEQCYNLEVNTARLARWLRAAHRH